VASHDPEQPDLPAPDDSRQAGKHPTPPLPDADEPPQRVCKNCGHLLAPTDKYCGNCRQKYAAHPASLRELFADFFDIVFNIDNRVLLSMAAIFIPGRLTNRYMAGIQRRYLSPIRFFFVTAIICLACVGFAIDEPLDRAFAQNEQQQARSAFHDMMADEVTDARDSVLTLFPQDRQVNAALDSLLQIIDADRSDTLGYIYFEFDPQTFEFQTVDVAMSAQDVVLMPIDTLLDTYEIEGFWHRLQLRQIIKINRNGGDATRFLLGQSVWALLLMVPFIALWLKLLYIRRSRYYIEHFVFTLHMHTFLFVLYTLALLLFLAFGWEDQLGIAGLIFAIYLYVSQYRVYRQGWFKTFVKYCLLGFMYWIFLSVAFLLTVVVSVLLY
jgi:hypothetical protein